MHWLQSLWWWFEVHTGTVRESGPYYGFWSGFGSDISEIGSVVGLFVLYYRHNNCHTPGCRFIGRHGYTKDGVTYKLCHRCVTQVTTKGPIPMITTPRTYQTGVSKVTHHPELHSRLYKKVDGTAPVFVMPDTWDQTMGMVTCNLLGNGRYGNCVPCDFFHGDMFKALLSFNDGKAVYEAGFTPPHTEFVEDVYFAYGKSLGEPGERPDLGSDPGTWAAYVIKTKHAEFSAEVELDVALGTVSLDSMLQAAVEFRGAALTINCPSQMQQQFERIVQSGEGELTVDASNQPDPKDGHGIWLCSFDIPNKRAKIATWGYVVWCSFEFLAACLTSVWVFGTKQDAEAAGYDFAAWEAVASTLPDFLDAVQPAPTSVTVTSGAVSSESLVQRLEAAIKGVPDDVKGFIKILHKASDAALEREAMQVIEALLADALAAYGHGLL